MTRIIPGVQDDAIALLGESQRPAPTAVDESARAPRSGAGQSAVGPVNELDLIPPTLRVVDVVEPDAGQVGNSGPAKGNGQFHQDIVDIVIDRAPGPGKD